MSRHRVSYPNNGESNDMENQPENGMENMIEDLGLGIWGGWPGFHLDSFRA